MFKKTVILLFLLALLPPTAICETLKTGANVVFVIIETLRSDHLSCYGYERDTTPFIDGIARKGLKFTDYKTVSPWTNPSIASLFTGYLPRSVIPPGPQKTVFRHRIPNDLYTLAEAMKDAGYSTLAILDHPSITSGLGFGQGFDVFFRTPSTVGQKKGRLAGTPSEELLDIIFEKLDTKSTTPFFMYLHIMYPHQPYTPPAPYDKMFGAGFNHIDRSQKTGIINMYDGEIRYTDEFIRGLWAGLEKRDLLEDTYIFLTADHGEGFWDHGYYEHGNSLYDELLKVPLIIYPPGGAEAPRDIGLPCSLVDLYPTVISISGSTDLAGIDGKDLFEYIRDNPGTYRDRWRYAESPYRNFTRGLSCRDSRYKFMYVPPDIFDFKKESGLVRRLKRLAIYLDRTFKLYDVENDPGETVNLAFRKIPTSIRMLTRLLARWTASECLRALNGNTRVDGPVQEDILRMKALGYLQ